MLTCCVLPMAGGLGFSLHVEKSERVYACDMSMCASGVHVCVPNKRLRL